MKDNKTKGFVETAKSLLGATPMGARASQQCEAQTDNYRQFCLTKSDTKLSAPSLSRSNLSTPLKMLDFVISLRSNEIGTESGL